MKAGDIVKVRIGRRGLWPVRILAIVNAGKNLRVQRIPREGPLKPPFLIKTERVAK